MDYLQAENQLKTFANETGGYAWFPQFDGEIPGNFPAGGGFSAAPIQHLVHTGKWRKGWKNSTRLKWNWSRPMVVH